jgi:hypothetical protein
LLSIAIPIKCGVKVLLIDLGFLPPERERIYQQLIHLGFWKPVLGISEICQRTKFGLGYVRSLTGRGVFLPKYPQLVGEGKLLGVTGKDATAAYWTMAEADIIKMALGNIIWVFDQHPCWQAHIGNMAHDEVDARANSDYALDVAAAIQSSMRSAMRQFIHCIPVDEGEPKSSLICHSWAEK